MVNAKLSPFFLAETSSFIIFYMKWHEKTNKWPDPAASLPSSPWAAGSLRSLRLVSLPGLEALAAPATTPPRRCHHQLPRRGLLDLTKWLKNGRKWVPLLMKLLTYHDISEKWVATLVDFQRLSQSSKSTGPEWLVDGKIASDENSWCQSL